MGEGAVLCGRKAHFNNPFHPFLKFQWLQHKTHSRTKEMLCYSLLTRYSHISGLGHACLSHDLVAFSRQEVSFIQLFFAFASRKPRTWVLSWLCSAASFRQKCSRRLLFIPTPTPNGLSFCVSNLCCICISIFIASHLIALLKYTRAASPAPSLFTFWTSQGVTGTYTEKWGAANIRVITVWSTVSTMVSQAYPWPLSL